MLERPRCRIPAPSTRSRTLITARTLWSTQVLQSGHCWFLTGDLNPSAPAWPARTQGAAPAWGHTLLFPVAMFIGCFWCILPPPQKKNKIKYAATGKPSWENKWSQHPVYTEAVKLWVEFISS